MGSRIPAAMTGLFLTFFLVSANAANSPLLDGRCGEYEALDAAVHKIDERMNLHVFQNADYVWLCYTLPPESHGVLDLRVESPGLAEPMNLHVSAQLGEWRADHPEEAPQEPNSDAWWNVSDWYSNALRLNGTRETENGRRTHFLWSEARELQLAKSRFGRGEWQLVLDIGMLRSTDGEMIGKRYPADGKFTLTSH